MRYRIITLLGALCLLPGACHKETSQDAMTPAAGKRSTRERAMDSLAIAACDHESACGKIGWERDFPTRSECLNLAVRQAQDHLETCQGEPDSDELQECLDSVAEEDCDRSLAALMRVSDCQGPELCRHTPDMPSDPNYNDDDIYEGTDDND